MKTIWFKGIPEADIEMHKKSVLASKFLLDILKEVCYNSISELDNASAADYDSPSWAYKQADKNGARRAYQRIIDICTIT